MIYQHGFVHHLSLIFTKTVPCESHRSRIWKVHFPKNPQKLVGFEYSVYTYAISESDVRPIRFWMTAFIPSYTEHAEEILFVKDFSRSRTVLELLTPISFYQLSAGLVWRHRITAIWRTKTWHALWPMWCGRYRRFPRQRPNVRCTLFNKFFNGVCKVAARLLADIPVATAVSISCCIYGIVVSVSVQLLLSHAWAITSINDGQFWTQDTSDLGPKCLGPPRRVLCAVSDVSSKPINVLAMNYR